MHPNGSIEARRRQRGFGLAAALALIVVVALFAATTVRMADTSAKAYGAEALSLRAFMAAETGSQLGLNRLFPPAGGGACGSLSFDLADFGLRGCSAAVACTNVTAGGDPFYLLESRGVCDAGDLVATRIVEVGAAP